MRKLYELVNTIRTWFTRSSAQTANVPEPVQDTFHLRMEITRLVAENEALRDEIRLLGKTSAATATASAEAQVRIFLTSLASPISRLLSMADRTKNGTQQFVFSEHARPLIDELRDKLIPHNVSIIGPALTVTPFDPGLHQPYGVDHVEVGQPVQVLLVGLQYSGETIHSATVIAHQEN